MIITRYLVAKKYELLREKLAASNKDTSCITVPTFAGMNVDLASLMRPNDPGAARKIAKDAFILIKPDLWNTNVAYNMKRYATLEECKSVLRYKLDSIEKLEKYLNKAVKLLHSLNLTHNDICLRNILYEGTYPNLSFHLADFGSITENTARDHEIKCAADLSKIKHVIGQLKQILEKKASAKPLLFKFASKRPQRYVTSPIKDTASPQQDKTAEEKIKKTNSKNKKPDIKKTSRTSKKLVFAA